MENLLSTNICISDSLKNRYPFDEGNNAVTFTLQTHASVQIMIYFGGAGQSASQRVMRAMQVLHLSQSTHLHVAFNKCVTQMLTSMVHHVGSHNLEPWRMTCIDFGASLYFGSFLHI